MDENNVLIEKDVEPKTVIDLQTELSKKALLECKKELESLLKKHNCRIEVSMMITASKIIPFIQLAYGNQRTENIN